MYRVQFTEPAEEDLLGAIQYISEVLKSPSAAGKLLSDTETRLKTLEETPLGFPLVRDEYLAREGIRSLGVNNYLVFYVVKENEGLVSVIRYLYARRDWTNILRLDTPHSTWKDMARDC